jgi:sulfur carrier protein
MKIQLNGHEREFGSPLSLSKLVEQLGMKEDRVAVELNRNIIPREMWPQTELSEGDRLEVVHFVGGGIVRAAPRVSGPIFYSGCSIL